MAPSAIVEGFDVIKGEEFGFASGGRDIAAEAFGLEGGDKALSERIVIGIGSAAHAGGDVVEAESLLESGAGVLHAAITVMNEPRDGPVERDGAFESARGQF